MTAPSINLRAARTVARHARDAADARHLLDVLGLVDDDGRLRPDGDRLVDYRNLAPDRAEATSRPRMVSRQPARCGSPSGASKHRKAGEKVCPPCLEGERQYQREWRAKKRGLPPPPPSDPRPGRKVAACGTVSGRTQHRRLGEPVCPACRDASAADQRERAAAKKAAAKAAHPLPEPVPEPVVAPPPVPPLAQPAVTRFRSRPWSDAELATAVRELQRHGFRPGEAAAQLAVTTKAVRRHWKAGAA